MEKIYEVKKDKIIVKDLSQFCIKHILECGQVFRFKRLFELENSEIKYAYEVLSLNKKAVILESDKKAVIFTKDTDYFINYFDLDTDYNQIKSSLSFDEIISNAINYGYGIRILKQDPFETIISFIISANNNIKRIQKSVNLISENYGENVDDFYAFPSIKQLKNVTIQEFRNLGVGFRDKYLVETIRELNDINLETLRSLTTIELSKFLVTLKGVGQKVADCIMLFAFQKRDVFPVDTWIKQVYNSYYAETKCDNVKAIREFLLNKFKDLSGFAQQYLFYYKREM